MCTYPILSFSVCRTSKSFCSTCSILSHSSSVRCDRFSLRPMTMKFSSVGLIFPLVAKYYQTGMPMLSSAIVVSTSNEVAAENVKVAWVSRAGVSTGGSERATVKWLPLHWRLSSGTSRKKEYHVVSHRQSCTYTRCGCDLCQGHLSQTAVKAPIVSL